MDLQDQDGNVLPGQSKSVLFTAAVVECLAK